MTRKSTWIPDFKNDNLVVKKEQDCSNILLNNKLDRDAGPNDMAFGRKIASVPIDILDAWIRFEGIDYRKLDNPAMKKRFFAKLNSRDWSRLKTYDGGI